jgi:hypothetical protein
VARQTRAHENAQHWQTCSVKNSVHCASLSHPTLPIGELFWREITLSSLDETKKLVSSLDETKKLVSSKDG